MANYEALTSAIQQAIKTNGNQEITGQVLQTVLLQMVNTLGTGAQFMGEATLTTDPGDPDASVFYIASIKGTYTHFGNLTLYTDEVAALSNATGAWTKTTLFHLQSGAPGWDTSKDPTAPLLATIKAGFGALGAYFWDNFISNSPLKTISSGKLGIASGLSGGNITIYLASNIPVAVTATYAYRSGGNNVVVTIPANGTVKMQISGTSAGSSDNLTFSFDYDIEEDHRCIGAVAVIESSDGGSDIDPSDYYTKTEADKKFATTTEVQPLETWNGKAQNSILVGMPKADMDSHNPEDLAVRSTDSVSVVMPGLDGNDLSANTQILATIAAASDTQAGVMSAADKAKLDTTLPVLSLSVTSITWPTEVEGNVQTTIQVAMPKEKVIAAFLGGMALQVLEGGHQPLQIFQSGGSAAQVYGYLLRYDSSNLGLYEFQANFGSASGDTTELSVTITLLKNL